MRPKFFSGTDRITVKAQGGSVIIKQTSAVSLMASITISPRRARNLGWTLGIAAQTAESQLPKFPE